MKCSISKSDVVLKFSSRVPTLQIEMLHFRRVCVCVCTYSVGLALNSFTGSLVTHVIFRFLDNTIILTIISVFAWDTSFECNLCPNSELRYAGNNLFISIYFYLGWFCTIFGLLLWLFQTRWMTGETNYFHIRS